VKESKVYGRKNNFYWCELLQSVVSDMAHLLI